MKASFSGTCFFSGIILSDCCRLGAGFGVYISVLFSPPPHCCCRSASYTQEWRAAGAEGGEGKGSTLGFGADVAWQNDGGDWFLLCFSSFFFFFFGGGGNFNFG